jgi:hypothetical protein
MSSPSSDSHIPKTGTRTTLCSSISHFLESHPSLHLGGDEDFHAERRKHLEVFGFHSISEDRRHDIGRVEFTAVRGPHGTIPVRVLYPSSGKGEGENGAWVYFHGGGYTVGSVDEFENGLRQVAEESGVQVRSWSQYNRGVGKAKTTNLTMSHTDLRHRLSPRPRVQVPNPAR